MEGMERILLVSSNVSSNAKRAHRIKVSYDIQGESEFKSRLVLSSLNVSWFYHLMFIVVTPYHPCLDDTIG